MKGIILTISVISFILTALSTSQARDISIDLRVHQQNVNVGEEVSVDVNIDQVSDLKGVNILISFDNQKLEYKSISKGALISDFTESIVPDPEDAKATGKIEYLAVLDRRGPGIDSPGGTILTINFVTRSPGDSWIKLLPNDIALGDSMANAIPSNIDVTPRTIQIGQKFAFKKDGVFNYPNPAPDASGKTVIRCELQAILDDLEARIYDISAELVKTIHYEDFDSSKAPIYEYEWNCKNENGQDVANGTYVLWVKAKLGTEVKYQTWKIAILR